MHRPDKVLARMWANFQVGAVCVSALRMHMHMCMSMCVCPRVRDVLVCGADLRSTSLQDEYECFSCLEVRCQPGCPSGAGLDAALKRLLLCPCCFVTLTLSPHITSQEAIAEGDAGAAAFRQQLRVVVAGGDGTIAWVLASIKKLALDPEPGVAIIPLGTGELG